MIRVVIEESPTLFVLAAMPVDDPAQLDATFERDGKTYYRCETHAHYVKYKAAISGWGATKPDPNKYRPGGHDHGDGPDARQR